MNIEKLRCPCKDCVDKTDTVSDSLLSLLTALEEEYNGMVEQVQNWTDGRSIVKYLIITSGLRCAKHNAEIGGSPTSSHIKGLAVDISCYDSTVRYCLIKAINNLGIKRYEIGETWCHLDCDAEKDSFVCWLP